ncbi:MAG: GNAT family N-acetyltransferase [Chloroflexi bacterium]|nr:GNAT family N-acetyltransferase [Chloroflexota bacterium]
MIQPEIRPLLDGEIPAAAAMLAEAFADDPLTGLLSPDPSKRASKARWYFSAIARYGLAFGEVWAVDSLDAVAIWWAPPFVMPSAARASYVGFDEGPAVLGIDVWEQSLEIGWMVGDVHAQAISEAHWYLNILGVRPERQRTGLGSALLASMLARLDMAGLPAYLDTGRTENVAYYERHGFRLAAEAHDPLTGIAVYGMRRDPPA